MKIAFISLDSHLNVKSWSGTNYFMFKSISELNKDTIAMGGLKINYKIIQYLIKIIVIFIFKSKYEVFRNPLAFNGFAKQVNNFIKINKPDIIVSAGSLPVVALKTDVPVFIWSDATFENLTQSYPWYSAMNSKVQKRLNDFETFAFRNASKVFMSSSWATESLKNDYKIDSSQFVELPFGANLNYIPIKEEVYSNIESKSLNKLKFLFLAVEAERKGLDRVLRVLYLLKQKGFDIELNVVGCNPNIDNKYKSFTNVIGFISKGTEEGMQKIEQYLYDSTLLFVPSLFEAFGLVFAEASAHGLPSITSNVGGIPSVVFDGKNGYKFELDEKDEVILSKIIEITSDLTQYKELCKSSFDEYEKRLNWKNSVEKLLQIIKQEIENK